VKHLSYANVVATLALFIALGGASYAATSIPKDSVGRNQIRDGSITKKKISSHTWDALKGNSGAQGAMGPIGLTGAKGAAGSDGVDGDRGTTGVTGSAGPTGPSGVPGSTGATGPVEVYTSRVPGPVTASNENSLTTLATLDLPPGNYSGAFSLTASYLESFQYSEVNCFFSAGDTFGNGASALLAPHDFFTTNVSLSAVGTFTITGDENFPPQIYCNAGGGEGPTISFSDVAFSATPVGAIHDQSPN
jgi:hypothetical protein